MKIAVFAVGRMKAGSEKELADRYFDRFAKSGASSGLEFTGVSEFPESRAKSAAERRREEAQKLQAQIPAGSALILLDERGKNLSSERFAERIAALRDDGQRGLAFAVGGPDGHDAVLRDEAALLLSFG